MTERTIVVSPQARTFCKALAATAAQVDKLLEQGANAGDSGSPFNLHEHATHNVNLIVGAAAELSAWLEGPASSLLGDSQADDLAIGRTVGRFEQIIVRLVDGYVHLESSPADGIHAQAHALIAAIYRHYLRQIVAWLNDLSTAVDDPGAWLADHADGNSARPTLVVELDLSTPPELKELVRLSGHVAREAVTSPAQALESGVPELVRPGFLARAGALAFALAIGSR